MAGTINLTLDGDESVFGFTPVDRSALYGKRRRIALDESGTACTKASLLDDGSMLVRSGMTGQGYFLPDGRWVPQAELEGINPDGTPADQVPSTIGVAQALTPVGAEFLLDLQVATTYALNPEQISDGLAAALKAGTIYSFPFNFRADYHAETGVLLANDAGYWALIGVATSPEWQELATVTTVAEASTDDAGDDDLDFEMF